ncbi:xanthine dehydrogenase small subunit [Saccharopolyspora shandongensis]|uniref:xanthine dehydrogenase small subunit n=1 Tax=Saccharopolyspora shandongensis TaxID=418495 RepID=UPI0033CAFBF4
MNRSHSTPQSDTTFTVNGVRRNWSSASAHTTVLGWLRQNQLTGSKEGCAEGECGACAILVAQPDREGGTSWTAVNSCLVPVAALDGQEILTAEGLGTPEELHPVQEAMAAAGGSQCGYCTPGFVCSMASEFYRRDRKPIKDAAGLNGSCDHEAEHGPNGFDLHALSGNLCRCTGYRPIRDAAYALGEPGDDEFAGRRDEPAPAFRPTDYARTDGRFVRATSLAHATALLSEHPDAVLVAGSTDWGVEVNIRARRAPFVVAIDRVPELDHITIGDDLIEIGAATPLSDIERVLAGRVPLLADLIPQFASRLIRNRATLGGNLGTASPIGDSSPVLLALDARIVLASAERERELLLKDYFTGYRATLKELGELIKVIRIPLPLPTLTAFHKIAKRRFDDISSVAVAFAIQIDDGVVTKARIGLGGVAATPLRAYAAEEALTGKPWTQQTTIRTAAAVLGREGTPMSDHRASAQYRSTMLSNALLKLGAESARDEEVLS